MISNALKFFAGFGIVALVIGATAWIWRMIQKDGKKADVKAAIDRGDIEPVKITAGTQGTFLGKTRGLRNNNPGNVEPPPNDKWQGQVGTDGRFVIFEDMEHGARAMIRLLKNYNKKYGINTIEGIIKRYAPPSENDVNAYVSFVTNKTGITGSTPLFLSAQDTYTKIAWAMSQHECGVEIPYNVFESGALLEV